MLERISELWKKAIKDHFEIEANLFELSMAYFSS
jgi:hypothetical protein